MPHGSYLATRVAHCSDFNINLFTSHALYLTNVSTKHRLYPVRLGSSLKKLTAICNHSLIAYLDTAIIS